MNLSLGWDSTLHSHHLGATPCIVQACSGSGKGGGGEAATAGDDSCCHRLGCILLHL